MRSIVAGMMTILVGCASSSDYYINHPPDYVVRTTHESAQVNRVMAIVTGVAGTILTIAGSALVAQGVADKNADCSTHVFLCGLGGDLEQEAGGLVLGMGLAHLVAAVILAATAGYQAAQ